jgi:Na+-driven multidrug efflux pump
MTAIGGDPRVLSGPAFRTLLRYVAASSVGLVAISTASLVDGIFVGNFVSSSALAAVGLLVPYFTLLFGTALMLAVGGTVRAGRHLGECDAGAASAVFSRALVATLSFSGAAAAVSTAFPHALFRFLGAPSELFPEMLAYFQVITWVLVAQLAGLVVYYFVRLDGGLACATTALVTGALANLALDALFIVGFGWGLPGAALATGLAQLLQLAVLFTHFRSGRGTLRFAVPRSGWHEVPRMAFNGASEFVNEVSTGLLMLVLNLLMLKRAGVDGVAAFSVVNYAIFLSLMIFYGVADALHVLLSVNLGARNAARIATFVRHALVSVIVLSVGFSAASYFGAERWADVFVPSSSRDVIGRAAEFLRLVSPLFLVNGLNVVFTVYLASMQQPLPAGLLAVARTLVLPTALMLTLDHWVPRVPFVLALPLAEWVTLLVALLLFGKFTPSLCVELTPSTKRAEAAS